MTEPCFVKAFPHRWSAEILSSPPLILPARQFVYPQNIPGEEDALHRGALLMQIKPATGGSFLATFALGFRDASLPSGLWTCPRPEDMLAVAGGYAYLVNTEQPATSQLLEQRPVATILPVPEHELLLLAGFHDVLALGPEGVRWRTGRLSWEGITLDGYAEGQLQGTGWDMFADAECPFTVELDSGLHQGGGYKVAAGSGRTIL